MATQQKTTFKIPKGYNVQERKVIAQELIDLIVKRTREKNIDKNGRPFKKYSKAYKESLDFKNAGKSGSRVDLTLSREMLNELDYLSGRDGQITVGYEKDNDRLNGKVEGNRKGTYGKTARSGRVPRDFLGLPESEINKIIRKYSLNRPNVLADRVAKGLAAINEAEETVKDGIETQPFSEA